MSAREVELSGGAPWGFRMHGGADQNQPLRISRVNPGRKASLSGVREGDVISSINGRATRGLSNADAHAMLRAAGPVLRLGLNEDREMSPRRRSIGKSGELKRPSQLLAEAQEATPQEPVYATIKPALSQNWSPSSPIRSSLNSLPAALNSPPLVKSTAPMDQPPKFHPTNPFYTTLPTNYASASKLPVPNGRSTISSLDRSKSMNKSQDTSSYDCGSLKSPSYVSTADYGSNSHLNSSQNFFEKKNGYGSGTVYSTANDKSEVSYDKINRENQSLPNDKHNELKNPFRPNRINSDPFEKYLNHAQKLNGTTENKTKNNMTNSMSDNNVYKTKEITERSTITEHKISETEEVKTVKKIVLNGSSDHSDQTSKASSHINMNGDGKNFDLPQPQSSKEYYQSSQNTTKNDYFGKSPTHHRNDNFSADNQGEQNLSSPNVKYHFVRLNNEASPGAEASSEVVTSKPPATPAAPAHSPTTKRTALTGHNITPSSLRDLCVRKVATFPYGDKILEELASVSKRLQNITIYGKNSNGHEKISKVVSDKIGTQQKDNMPYYPLPDVSCIEKVSLPTKDKDKAPPPVQPRNSSLKLSQDENHWVGMPTETDPVYVCLSPSQKMLMEKTNTVISKEDASQLVDMHKKYVDRRGYNEYYDKEQRKENQRLENPPVVPFKSQTGSRLLALIRDPAVTDNISSVKTRNQLKILDQIQSIDKMAQSSSYRKYESHRSANEICNNFKPIPPPRTRKFSSSFYESDESSDFTDSSFRSMKSERKHFHFSTGNLNKEIENDISSIQNMHRYCTDVRDHFNGQSSARPRRPSLPKDLCDQQMEYIRRKEKEVEAEIRRLESEKINFPGQEKQRLGTSFLSETRVWDEKITHTSSQSMLLKKDSDLKVSTVKSPNVPEKRDKGKLALFSSSQEELLRDKMYSEYINQMAEREERRQQKVIKITNNNKPIPASNSIISKSMPALDILDSKVNNRIEKEFIWKARERWNKLGIKDPETEDERDLSDVYREPKVIEHKIKVIEGGEEKDMKKLPNHLQEFVRFTVKDTDQGKSSPGESRAGPASPHVLILCAVIILVMAVGKFFLRMLRNK